MTHEWPAGEHATPHATRHALRRDIASTLAYFVVIIYTAAVFAGEDGVHLLGENLLVTLCTLGLLGLFFMGVLRLFDGRDERPRRW